MSQHSPGPFGFDPHNRFYLVDGNGMRIAECLADPEDTCMADKKLFVAAPDMADILEKITKAMEDGAMFEFPWMMTRAREVLDTLKTIKEATE